MSHTPASQVSRDLAGRRYWLSLFQTGVAVCGRGQRTSPRLRSGEGRTDVVLSPSAAPVKKGLRLPGSPGGFCKRKMHRP